jgi:hypothetical protein
MKWKNEMSSRGLNETNVSQGLKTKIKDFYELEEGIKSLKEAIDYPSVNDDVEELKADLEELEEAKIELDRKLVDAIIFFDKNKEKYAEKVQKMKEGREKKKGIATSTADKKEEVKQQPTATATPSVQQMPKEESKEGEKKKSNIGNWIFGLAIAGLTLGLATQYLKNRD